MEQIKPSMHFVVFPNYKMKDNLTFLCKENNVLQGINIFINLLIIFKYNNGDEVETGSTELAHVKS